MTKIKLLSILVIGLLVANITLIVFLFLDKNERHKHEGPRDEVIQKLGFTLEQIVSYDSIILDHIKAIKKVDKQIMELKNELYKGLNHNSDSILKDSLIFEIGKTQIQVENIHYKHFEKLKTICNPGQQMHKFEKLTTEIAKLFNHKPKK